MRLWRERTKGHGRGNESSRDIARGFDRLDSNLRTRWADFEQIAKILRFGLRSLRRERCERCERQSSSLLGGTDHGLQCAHCLRLPLMRLGTVSLAEAHETVIRKLTNLRSRHNSCFSFGRLIVAIEARPRLANIRFYLFKDNAANGGGHAGKARI